MNSECKSIATMKKMIKNLMLVAVAAMAFVACSQEGNEVNILTKKTVFEFTAGFEDETRSSFGEKNEEGVYPSFWNGNESITVVFSDAEGVVGVANSRIDSLGEGVESSATASFTIEYEGELPENYSITAYSGNWYYDEYTKEVYYNLSNAQRCTDISVDSYSHLCASNSIEVVSGELASKNFTFNTATSFGKVTMPQFASNASAIEEVVVTINGTTTFEITPSELATPTVWFACDAIESVTSLVVEAKVDGVTYIKSSENIAEGALSFNTGRVRPIKVSEMTEKPADYEVVLTSYTVNSDYSDRKIWLFSNEEGDYLSIPFNQNIADELPAGAYTYVDMCYQFSSDNALEYARYDTSYNLVAVPNDNGYARWADDVIVIISRDEHNMLDFTAYVTGSVNGYSKTTKFTYKEEYIEVVEFDGTIKSWTHTNTSYPTYYQIIGDNFSFEIGFYNNRENYIDNRDSGYTLGDAGWYARYFAIRNLVISGESLTASAGTVTTNTAGTAGAIHDIDITLTANGNDYDFSYYGYINGAAVDNGGTEVPSQPTQLATPTGLDATATVDTATITWEAVANASSYDVTVGTTTKNVTALTATFEGLTAETTYDVSVVAVGDGTTYTNSSAATTTVTTEADPNAPATSDIEIIEYSGASGGNYTDAIFSYNDELNRKIGIVISFNKGATNGLVPAGTYSLSNYLLESSYSYWGYGLSSSEYESFSTLNVIVSVDNDLNTFVVTGTTNKGRNISFTYTGKL